MMPELVVPGCWRVGLNGVNAYLVDAGGDGLVLIDTGTPTLFHPQRLLRAMTSVGRRAGDVTDILITHQHIDHAGGLRRVAAATGAAVHVHQLDAPEIEAGERPRPTIGRGPLTRLAGLGSRIMRVGPAAVDDHLRDGDHLLENIGIRAIHTPGHTAGHTAYLWPHHGGVLFTGDAIANWRFHGRITHAPLAEDWARADNSVATLAELEFAVAAFGHGSVIRDGAVARVRRFAEQVAGSR